MDRSRLALARGAEGARIPRVAAATLTVFRAIAAMALLASLAALASGCQPRRRYDPIPADSTAVSPFDSLAITLREAAESWSDGGGETAAEATAQALARDLERRPDDVPHVRAQTLLDSLGIGAEVAGDGRVVAVNLFSRSEPGAGTWPYLLWREDAVVRHRGVSGQGLQLVDVATRSRDERWSAVALLFSRRAGSGRQPFVLVYGRPRAGAWTPQQSLGADSLGGFGEARFTARTDTSAMLASTAWSATPRFEECSTCPHVVIESAFAWGPQGFHRVSRTETPSPYATFVRFVEAMATGDVERSALLAVDAATLDSARVHGLGESRGRWRVAPGTNERSTRMVFYRGGREAYAVTFTRLGESWLVQHIAPTSRPLD
jgi:hypothetical protein